MIVPVAINRGTLNTALIKHGSIRFYAISNDLP